VRLLLDTHLAFWWQTGDSRLDGAARRLVEDSDASVLVSRVSLWELAIKAGLGRLRIDLPVFASQVEAMGFSWLPIQNAHILHLARLPVFPDHRDPFDRLLVAQSASEPLVLLTADASLGRYGDLVRVI
jgi:PIN domain nuclease of toxin-antitoxin system